MKFSYPPLTSPIILSDEYISSLVVENRKVFFNLVTDLYNQTNKCDGKVVFSIADKVEDVSKNIELLTQFVPFDTNKKALITKLHQRIKDFANSNYYNESMQLISSIENYMYVVTETIDANLMIDAVDVAGLLKISNVRFSDENNSLVEAIYSYCKSVISLEGNRLFIFVGLRSYIEDDEFLNLAKTMVDHKVVTLFIDNHCYKTIDLERRVVIDDDMCVI